MRFAVVIVILYLLVAIRPSNDHLVVPFTEGIVAVSAGLLRALREPVATAGTIMSGGGFAMNVKNGCNGLEAVIILVAAVVAFPATARQRALGLALGVILIQVLNLVRVVSLFWLGVHRPSVFELFHAAIWQSGLILVAVAFFVVWSRRIARAGAGSP